MNGINISIIVLTCLLILNIPLSGQQNKEANVTLTTVSLPVATIAGLNSGLIDKDTLMKAESLACPGKNNKIISFTFFRLGGELRSKSDSLTVEMKKSIGDMRTGSKLIFSDITARTSDGRTISLSPIILKIK